MQHLPPRKMEDKAKPDPGSQRGMEPALAGRRLSCLVDIALANAADPPSSFDRIRCGWKEGRI